MPAPFPGHVLILDLLDWLRYTTTGKNFEWRRKRSTFGVLFKASESCLKPIIYAGSSKRLGWKTGPQCSRSGLRGSSKCWTPTHSCGAVLRVLAVTTEVLVRADVRGIATCLLGMAAFVAMLRIGPDRSCATKIVSTPHGSTSSWRS